MKIVLLTTTNSRLAGGLYNSVRNLGLSILRKHTDIVLMSYNDKFSAIDKRAYEEMPMQCYHRSSFPFLKTLGYSNNVYNLLQQENPDIIHTQGIWMYNSYVAQKYKSIHNNCVLIITPRGMLDPWAIKNSAWKKKIAGWLFEYKNLRTADCIHALCQSEYESIRKFGLKNPVAIIPNGINIPNSPVFNRSKKKKTLLFIGRIHPKKGLKELLLGLKLLKDRESKYFQTWNIRIAGWSQIGHIEELQRIVFESNLNNNVEFIGSVYGDDKAKELCNANAFVLPSFSEGLPMSILEAWSYKLPVAMTDFCNIPNGFATNSAIRIEPTPESIAKGLEKLFIMNDTELEAMGNNGYTLVKDNFSWDHIAKQTIQLYEYLLNGSEKPEFVYE